ncbi:MAG: helix-turn-helix domain-containing protein [Chitinivibrionales bacterium]
MYRYLLFVLILVFFISADSAHLFDLKDLSWSAFNDSADSGNSESQGLIVSDQKMTWSFSLRDNAAWPYIGACAIFQLPDSTRGAWKTYSEDDTLVVIMRSNRRGPVIIQLCTFDPHVTQLDDPVSFRVLQSPVTVSTSFQRISIPLNSFTVAQWWKQRYEVAPEDNNLFLDSICMVEWVFTDTNRVSRTDTLVVTSLGFVRRSKKVWILYAVFICGILLSSTAGWLWSVNRKKNKQKTEVGGAPDEMKPRPVNLEPSEWEKIRSYFENHYREPELNLGGSAKVLCLSESKLSRLIRANHKGGFRSLIHDLRIKESKRLLLKTDFHVAEIAHKIGYATASHFNREFKQREGLTPTAFRKNMNSASRAE